MVRGAPRVLAERTENLYLKRGFRVAEAAWQGGVAGRRGWAAWLGGVTRWHERVDTRISNHKSQNQWSQASGAGARLDGDAKKIKVRVVTDSTQAGQGYSKVQALIDAGITLNILGNTNWSMHHKFYVLDGRIGLNGSFNWSERAAFKNMENIIVTSSPKLIRKFQQEFAGIVKLNLN